MRDKKIISVICFLSLLFVLDSGVYASRWWKGNLHTHTLWSDGRDFPEMVAAWYKDNGYNFLCLSDHNRLSVGGKAIKANGKKMPTGTLEKYIKKYGDEWVEHRVVDGNTIVGLKALGEFRGLFEEPNEFLFIQAEEITEKKAHVNAINLVEVIKPKGGNTALEVMQNNVDAVLAQRKKTGQAMMPHINHPNWKWQLTAEDIMQVRGGNFFEIYNGAPAVFNYGDKDHVSVERMWDIILTKRLAELGLPIMYGVATDDAHHYHSYSPVYANPGRGWIVVRADRLEGESIVKAMEAGDFYASTGVVLKDVQFDGRRLTIIIEPKAGVSYTTQFIGTRKGYDPRSWAVLDEKGAQVRTTRVYSDDIGRVFAQQKGEVASYGLSGNEIYLRAKVISTRLKDNPYAEGDVEVAWVQPVVPGK
jgi:hypothetical protein